LQDLRNGKDGGVQLLVCDATMIRDQDGPVGELFNRFFEKQSQINGVSPPDMSGRTFNKERCFFQASSDDRRHPDELLFSCRPAGFGGGPVDREGKRHGAAVCRTIRRSTVKADFF